MPPKKPAADSEEPSSSEAPVEATAGIRADVIILRRLIAHPSTAIMVKEALTELDSRKGVSSQAIQGYIKQNYPTVDMVRLKHLVRKTLKKGIEDGTLVRPASSSDAAGAMGKFRLAPKQKESKPKNENVDPNTQKAAKPVKDGAKKPKKAAGATKRDSTKEQTHAQEESKPPKKSKKAEGAATTKGAKAKKPKAKVAAENEDGEADSPKPKGDDEAVSDAPKPKGDDEAVSDAPKPKAAKKTKESKKPKEAKVEKASKRKAAKADGGDAPASKATGKRGKKPAE